MIAARLAAVVIVLAASARAAAAVDGGAGTDGGTADGDVRDGAARDGGSRDGHDGAGDASAAPGDAAADAVPDATTDAPSAPTVPLRGRVLQKGTRRPLAGAAVIVDGVAAGESGADGRFELRVAPGRHRVQIQTPGTTPPTRPSRRAPARPAPWNCSVWRPASPASATRPPCARSAPRSRRSTSAPTRRARWPARRAIRCASSARCRACQQIIWPAAVYVVRGANPGNTGFYLDGVRVPALFHIALGPSVIHPYLIGGVDFYPGAYPPTSAVSSRESWRRARRRHPRIACTHRPT